MVFLVVFFEFFLVGGLFYGGFLFGFLCLIVGFILIFVWFFVVVCRFYYVFCLVFWF